MSRHSRQAIKYAALALAIADQRLASVRGRSGGGRVQAAGLQLSYTSDHEVTSPEIAQIYVERARLVLETIKLRSENHDGYRANPATMELVTEAIRYADDHVRCVDEFSRIDRETRAERAEIAERIASHRKWMPEQWQTRNRHDSRLAYWQHELELASADVAAAQQAARKTATLASFALGRAQQASSQDARQFYADAIEEAGRNVRRAADILVMATECGLRVKNGQEPTDEWAVARAARSILAAARAMNTAEDRVEELSRQLFDGDSAPTGRTSGLLVRRLGRLQAEAQVADYAFGRALRAAAAPTFAISRDTRGSAGVVARMVRLLMPRREGLEWWGDLSSMLGEADADERQQFIKSYLRSAPRVLVEAWAGRLFGARRAVADPLERESALFARPDDPPGWRLAFSVIGSGRTGWWRIVGLLALVLGGLVATAAIAGGATAAVIIGSIASSVAGGVVVARRRKNTP